MGVYMAIKRKANEVLRRLFVKQLATLNEVNAFRTGGMSLFVVICYGNLQKEIPMYTLDCLPHCWSVVVLGCLVSTRKTWSCPRRH